MKRRTNPDLYNIPWNPEGGGVGCVGDTWGAIMIGGGKAGKLYVKDQVICKGGGSGKGNGIVGSMIKARKSHKEENQTEMGS